MTKHYCDRCGQLCDGFRKHGKYTIRESESYSFCSLDLCDECQKELDDWMKNKEIKSNNPAKNVKSPLLPVKNIFR